jgi:predicted TIM-barrel fold metal-dependent hydrolase
MSLRKIDCHVHIVGDGSSGSACWFSLPTLYKKFLGRMMVRGLGLPMSTLKSGLDQQYAENLAQQVRESDLDAAVILAQDIPYSDDGNAMPDDAQFYVPNEYVADIATRHPELIPACSIHPGRPDAMEELERCIVAKMPVLKLLPNCLNINYDDDRYLPFWRRMAEVGMILLSHTGGELTVEVYDASFGDPNKLTKILDCGVTVIAAHSAGRSGIFDSDWTGDLLSMFERYPNLYADNSALCSPNRARTLKHILPTEVQQRIIHGSDYPVPVSGVGPWLCGKLAFADHWKIKKSKNIIQRDYLLKKAIGFELETFTRMDDLLKLGSSSLPLNTLKSDERLS